MLNDYFDKISTLVIIIVFFILGIAVGVFYVLVYDYNYSFDEIIHGRITTTIPKIHPNNFFDIDHIYYYQGYLLFNYTNLTLQSVAATHSMEPTMGRGNHLICVPFSDTNTSVIKIDALEVGDIVTYRNKDGELITHRVISLDKDEIGYFLRLGGDNNPALDREKVRNEQLVCKVVGILY